MIVYKWSNTFWCWLCFLTRSAWVSWLSLFSLHLSVLIPNHDTITWYQWTGLPVECSKQVLWCFKFTDDLRNIKASEQLQTGVKLNRWKNLIVWNCSLSFSGTSLHGRLSLPKSSMSYLKKVEEGIIQSTSYFSCLTNNLLSLSFISIFVFNLKRPPECKVLLKFENCWW